MRPTTRFAALLDAWLEADPSRRDAAFAEAIGVDPSMVSRLRRGAVRINTVALAKACDLLGATAEDVVAIYEEAGHGLPSAVKGAA